MSATLISNNTTIKISAAVNLSNGSITGYTVPANSYLLFNASAIFGSAGSNAVILLNGFRVAVADGTVQRDIVPGLVAGAGSTLTFSNAIDGTGNVTGVLFTNTP